MSREDFSSWDEFYLNLQWWENQIIMILFFLVYIFYFCNYDITLTGPSDIEIFLWLEINNEYTLCCL